MNSFIQIQKCLGDVEEVLEIESDLSLEEFANKVYEQKKEEVEEYDGEVSISKEGKKWVVEWDEEYWYEIVQVKGE
jgi:hypothetical protein